MKVFSGITGITETFIAQGAYAALDYIQNLFRNLDSVGIDSAQPGQLVTLSGTENLLERIGAGSYRINAPALVGGVIPSAYLGGGLPVLVALPASPSAGEAVQALCYLPAEESIILDLGGDGMMNIAYTDANPPTSVVSTSFPVIDTVEKKFNGSMHFPGGSAGDSTHMVQISNPAFYAPGSGIFTLELWIKPITIGYGSIIVNAMPPGNNGAGSFALGLGTAVGNGELSFKSADNSVSIVTAANICPVDVWSYILLERYAGKDYLFVNDTLVSTAGGVTDEYIYDFRQGQTSLDIGRSNVGESVPLNAYIEGFALRPGNTYTVGNSIPLVPPTAIRTPNKQYGLVTMLGTATTPIYMITGRMGQ